MLDSIPILSECSYLLKVNTSFYSISVFRKAFVAFRSGIFALR